MVCRFRLLLAFLKIAIGILTGMVLALGIGIGAVTLFLSRFSDNYVSMLLKAFPLLVAMGGFFATWVIHYAFFFHPAWDYAEFFVSKGAEAVCIAVLLIMARRWRDGAVSGRENWSVEQI